LGVQFGRFGDKEGVFALYETVRGKKKLQFRTFEKYPFTTKTNASDGKSCRVFSPESSTLLTRHVKEQHQSRAFKRVEAPSLLSPVIASLSTMKTNTRMATARASL
jgi:hypothetical protein